MANTPVGTIRKYQQAIGIKKRNEYIQAWAAPCARDVAVVFWATWKDIEARIPKDEDQDFKEADTPAKRRGAKNKYNAIVREAVRKHTAELQSVLEYYDYKCYLAGFVEQARKMGCLSRFLTLEERKRARQQESATLSEASFQVFGVSPEGSEIGVFTDDNGKTAYATKIKGTTFLNKWSNTNGIGTSIPSAKYDDLSVYRSDSYQNNVVRPTKRGGEKLPTAKKMAQQLGNQATPKASAPTSVSGRRSSISVAAGESTWVNVPNSRAQAYAKKNAASAVTGINKTTRNEIARIVQNGVDTGMSYGDIAKAINAKFEQFAVPKPQKHIANRGVLVAVTELANAYCAANYEVGDMLQKSGVKMMKIWSTMEDNRVSDGCRANQDAGWIELDKPFPSGDMTPPRFPGCRCDFYQDMLDESMLGRSADDYFDMQGEEPIEVPVQPKQAAKKATGKPKQRVKEKVKPAASDRKAKSRVPDWKQWGKIEQKFYDVSNDSVDVRIRDAFMKGRKAARYRIKNQSALNLLKAHDISFSNMEKDGIRAIKEYTSTYYDVINNVLRTGDGDDDDKKLIKSMKKAISEHGATTEDIVVTRNFEGSYWGDWKEGETRKLPEFLSTTVANYRESGFTGENVAHIYVPANKGNGVYIDGESEADSECEYLIQAGSSFRVHHIEKIGDKTHYYLELIVQ